MNTSVLTQLGAVMRLEMKKTFFTRRGWWVYILAFAPALLYLIHAIDTVRNHEQRLALAAAHPVSTEAIRAIAVGTSMEDVKKQLGEPYFQFHFKRREFEAAAYRYTDGDSDFNINFFNDAVTRIDEQDRCNLQKDSAIFATTFQFFYLRLAVFFGCVGIFTNLFRGEMLDKSLHFYLLAPMRREVLLAGKYLAGLTAAVVTFTLGTALQIAALSWHFDAGAVPAYLQGSGWHDIGSYLGVTALACVGYGGIFLAAGLLFRNPILPAAGVLLWEAANIFLPAALKKISVIFYLQSLCPLVASPDKDMSAFLKLLLTSAEPAAPWLAITGLLTVTLLVLAVAGVRARKLEINYGTE
jgi:ABC-type transport system involved in multi-copper enzyme maturation permease subunit